MAKSKKKKSIDRNTARDSTSRATFPWRSGWLWALALVVLVLAVFSPAWWAGYLWDDAMFVTGNPVLYSPEGLVKIWTTRAADVCPLTLTLFWAIHPLFEMDPQPYHIITLLLHAGCALALWQVLKLLRVPGAWLGAALWAIHPVNVESVAWISEAKNTFSGLFFLLSAFFFLKMLRAEDAKPRGFDAIYAWSLVFAAAAMAAKSSTVILPVVLGLAAWWIDGRWNWRWLVRLAPMVVFAISAGLVSMWTQYLQQVDIGIGHWQRSWPERLVTAGDAICFYLGKLVWPDPLMMIYPRWQIDATKWTSWVPLVAAIAVFAVFWLKRASWARPWFFAYAYFLIAVLPVAGLLDNYFLRFSFVADHFQYLASIGPLALAGAGIARCADFVKGKQWLPAVIGVVVILVLAIASWNDAWVFQSEKSMWSETLAHNPACWVGANDLGNAYAKDGDLARAGELYQKAADILPDYPEAQNNLGGVALESGHIDEALAYYHKALKLDPHYADAAYNIAYVALQQKKYDEALKLLKDTLVIDPNYPNAHYNIGNILLDRRQMDDAIAEFKKAIEVKPTFIEARNNLAYTYAQMGKYAEAKAQVEEILHYEPNDANARKSLGQLENLENQQQKASP